MRFRSCSTVIFGAFLIVAGIGQAIGAAPTLATERQIIQQGFAIALANTVLQSQVLLLAGAGGVDGVPTHDCTPLSNVVKGTSGSVIANVVGELDTGLVGRISVFFDDRCARKYIQIESTAAGQLNQYFGIDGKTPIGSMNTVVKFNSNTGAIAGTGLFLHPDGTKASLGLFSNLFGAQTQLTATGLIAQYFTDLAAELGSTTPLLLKTVGNESLAFAGTGTGYTGTQSALSIVPEDLFTLKIVGGTSNTSSLVVNGFAGSFSLLPAVPTGWTVVDQAGDLKFETNVVSETIRNSVATVTRISTGQVIARAAVDQSGTGTVTYSNGATGIVSNWVLCGACNWTGAVVEFYNAPLDNFFITANSQEAAAIDNGAAGPGWARTGAAFNFKSGGGTSVCRFYGSMTPGPNSHFYTASTAECNGLKAQQATTPASQPRWNFESLDFVTTPSSNGVCPAGTVPVYRAYNNGFARRVDSNHRITTSAAGIAAVVAKGWISEGIVMCAPG